MSAADTIPVAIVGAGPAGLACALALARRGIGCEVLDARAAGAAGRDPRALALSHGSRQILDALGIADALDASPIRTIHVSQRGRFGRTLMRAGDYGLSALGHVVRAGRLAEALAEAARSAAIPIRYGVRVENVAAGPEDTLISVSVDGETRPALRARLAVFAEGGAGADRDVAQHDYRQVAVIAVARVARPHEGAAWERFTGEGPVALLPFGEDYAVVLVTRAEEATRLAGVDDETFLQALQARFGDRVRFTSSWGRAAYPLALRYRRNPVSDRCVWLGNSAQTLHPVAGQGFNLALRDVMALADALGECAEDPGARQGLARYAESRRLDRAAAIGFTDLLVRVFSNDNPLLGGLRGAGLLALDLLPTAREFLVRRMMFGARAWP